MLLCPPPWGVDILFLLFSPSDVRRPMSGVTHGFRSFKGKVLELLSPNLVCRLIGSVACLKPSNCQTMWVIELKSLNFKKEMPVYLNFEY